MRQFETFAIFQAWFNIRYFSGELAYLKSQEQEVISVTSTAIDMLYLNIGSNLNQQYTLFSDIKDIAKLDSVVLQHDSMIVNETWLVNNELEFLIWRKIPIMIENQIYILVEQYNQVNIDVQSIFKLKQKQKRPITKHFSRFKVKITEQEKAILFLLILGLSTFQIAEILYIAEETVRGHVYNKISFKFQQLGYEVMSRDDVIEVAKILNLNKLPEKLEQYFKGSNSLAIIPQNNRTYKLGYFTPNPHSTVELFIPGQLTDNVRELSGVDPIR